MPLPVGRRLETVSCRMSHAVIGQNDHREDALHIIFIQNSEVGLFKFDKPFLIVGGYETIKDIPSKWRDGEPFLGCRQDDYVSNEGGDLFYGEAKGKIAIIGRGECYYWEKVMMAHQAGAIGIVIINK